MMKKTITLLCAAATLSLAGCHLESNPLTTAPKPIAAKFLAAASSNGAQALNIQQDSMGFYYGWCMQGKLTPKLCKNLYAEMLKEARKTKAFKSLTRGELTDKKMFESLQKDYNQAAFYQL